MKKVVPAWYKDFHEHPHRPDSYSAPSKGHPVEYIHGLPHPNQAHQHYPSNWEYSGPGLGAE